MVAERVRLPEGVHVEWSGEFEHQVRAAKTLRLIIPAVAVLISVIVSVTVSLTCANSGLAPLDTIDTVTRKVGLKLSLPLVAPATDAIANAAIAATASAAMMRSLVAFLIVSPPSWNRDTSPRSADRRSLQVENKSSSPSRGIDPRRTVR